MGRTACTEPQCLYKGALYLTSVPVQGCTLPHLSACTRVHFTLPQCLYKGALYLKSVPYKGALYLTSVPVQGRTLPYLSACKRVHFTYFFTPSTGDCVGPRTGLEILCTLQTSDIIFRKFDNYESPASLPQFNTTTSFVNQLPPKRKLKNAHSHVTFILSQYYNPVEMCRHTVTHGREVKGKLAKEVGSQYSSHYLGTWCIQHYYR